MMRVASISLLLLAGAAASSLRKGHMAPRWVKGAGRCQKSAAERKAAGINGHSFLEVDAGALPPEDHHIGEGGGVYADGFSRYGCDIDVAPPSEQLLFKDHACGEVDSCRLSELGKTAMTPRLCFDFCRQFENAKFFGIAHGRDCYCSTYIHARSEGGGDCNLPCMGDEKEMCGGEKKSSLFEMHMCGDSAEESKMALEDAEKAQEKCDGIVEDGEKTADKLKGLVSEWSKLGVCSVEPQGALVCEYGGKWEKQANKVETAVKDTAFTAEVLGKRVAELEEASKAKADAEKATAELASKEELATQAAKEATVKALGEAATGEAAVSLLNGPFKSEKKLDGFDGVFTALGNTEKDWHGICALEPVEGESYAAIADDEPSFCGSRCLALPGTCVGFNYQYKDGMAACQLLSDKGLVKPTISKAIPIFEVSKTKMEALGLDSLSCYAHGAFIGGHPAGPLKTSVIREVTVDNSL
eukprot:gnl/TRDRNA2_/TRDRNA2_188211_c0_seq1.p1 gnl/TRDRNA2_/TRDRNA2_188211_c0~~gnl/TRDRNA2_/TRDRNA2_188211_c0_seq1.p1  ORF type:complete len:471 (-),score=141.00 gnl/TRDRNA2_/TRDRNA2_188211_c0_seq1:121-1533(-)